MGCQKMKMAAGHLNQSAKININKILQVSSILIFVLIFFHSVSTKDFYAENGSDNKVFNHDDFRKNINE